jgi:hypothetical protein
MGTAKYSIKECHLHIGGRGHLEELSSFNAIGRISDSILDFYGTKVKFYDDLCIRILIVNRYYCLNINVIIIIIWQQSNPTSYTVLQETVLDLQLYSLHVHI